MSKDECKTDDEFFKELVDRYYNDIYYYCKKLVSSQPQLEDIVEECTQDTFLDIRVEGK